MRGGLVALALVACGGHRLVTVEPAGPAHGGFSGTDATFEVVPRLAGARDPLPVGNSDVAFVDLPRALGHAVLRAVAPYHDGVLTVELVRADADFNSARLSVSLVVRATLRSSIGNQFIATTTTVCHDGAITDPESGAPVLWSCMARIGSDLSHWLADVPPQGAAP
ncbi:MAG: hypothetical protein JO257_26790 [Deltaproteobacteria bacterium]|nr:hypothetical protein [Deltaproteobacteria bacterium]